MNNKKPRFFGIKNYKIIFDKKGAIGLSFSQVIWVFRLIFLGMAIMFCLLLILMYVNVSYDPKPAEREILIQRILFSPNGISYYNPLTGMIESGTVDLRKFENNVLDKAIHYDRNYMGARMELEDLDEGKNYAGYYNQDFFQEKIVLKGLEGRGGIDILERNFYVLIKDGEEIHKGNLKFEVVMTRT